MVAEDGDRRNLLLIAFVVVLVAAGLIFALLLSETHGQNISGAAFASSSDIPAGYSPPWNIFANNEPFLTVSVGDATDSSLPVNVTASQTGMIFYKYFYVAENGVWQRHNFTQDTISSSSWIADEASATTDIDLSTLGEGSDNYVVTYACTKENGAWKCGCSAPTVCNQWSIQDFTNPVSNELPGCVPDPECSGKADGDTFCVASRPSHVYTCTEDADGCLVVSNESCTSGECVASDDTATCLPSNPHECKGPPIPDPSTIACGESQTIDNCGQNIIVDGTQCDSGTCVNGACVVQTSECTSNTECNDTNPCTEDTCDDSTGNCVNSPLSDNACSIGAQDGTCQGGVCVVSTSGCDAPKCYDDIAQVCVDELGVRALDIMAEGQVCVNGEWGPEVPLQ